MANDHDQRRDQRDIQRLHVVLERGDDPALVQWLSSQFGAVFQRLDNLEKHLVQQDTRLDLMEKNIMANLDQVLTDIQDESTAIDGVVTLIAGLKQQIADALSGVTLPPAIQAKVDAVFAGAEANKAKLAAVLTTTPTGQPVPPPPAGDANAPTIPTPTDPNAPATPATPSAGSTGGGL